MRPGQTGAPRPPSSLDLNRGTAQDRLYSRFVVAVKTEDGYEAVSDYHYITNPETVAENQKPYRETLSKKGLQMEVSQLGDALSAGGEAQQA